MVYDFNIRNYFKHLVTSQKMHSRYSILFTGTIITISTLEHFWNLCEAQIFRVILEGSCLPWGWRRSTVYLYHSREPLSSQSNLEPSGFTGAITQRRIIQENSLHVLRQVVTSNIRFSNDYYQPQESFKLVLCINYYKRPLVVSWWMKSRL